MGSAAVALVGESALRRLLSHFPTPINYAFAYGSGVFSQQGQGKGKMLDVIFVVDNPVTWHGDNLEMNRDHYSGLKYLGPRAISYIQENMACGVYYNPYVRVEGQLIKYGVISRRALEKDCLSWHKIYIAGRLQKPVMELKAPTTHSLVAAIKFNRESAIRAVLLQRGRVTSKFDFYHALASISYLGDSRMGFAENPDKVRNIVAPLLGEFEGVYKPLMSTLIPKVEEDEGGFLVQEIDPNTKFKHLMELPNQLQRNLVRQLFQDPRLSDIEEVMGELSYVPSLGALLRNAVAETVWSSSIRQTLQGLASAGPLRSVYYAWEKLKKARVKKK